MRFARSIIILGLVWLLLTLFALVNSSDVFLILRVREVGFSHTTAIGGYIGYNIIFALAAFPAGKLSDKRGRKKVMVFGFFLYAIVYAGCAFADNSAMIWGLFALYGLYAALTEGVSKAWISDLVLNAHGDAPSACRRCWPAWPRSQQAPGPVRSGAVPAPWSRC